MMPNGWSILRCPRPNWRLRSAVPAPHAQVYCVFQIGYFKGKRDLPFTGFYVGADLNLNSGDNSAKDPTLLIGYESSIGLGIEVGVKTF